MSQCWAYDQRQRRCEQDAGHEGDHAIIIAWNDEECYKPEVAVRPVAVSRETLEPAAKEEKKPAACAACQHRHKGGACKCGCYNQIG